MLVVYLILLALLIVLLGLGLTKGRLREGPLARRGLVFLSRLHRHLVPGWLVGAV